LKAILADASHLRDHVQCGDGLGGVDPCSGRPRVNAGVGALSNRVE
jgi:hypothetical protein